MTNRLACCAILLATSAVCHALSAAPPGDPYEILLKPIPEKLIVLTFDDSCRSHATFVGPLLKTHGFGATFYITEFGKSFADKTMYMTWEQIKQLEDMGFEVGNHTVGHGQLSATGLLGCNLGLTLLEEHCLDHHVAKPTTFCWPFYSVNNKFIRVLSEKGYLFARGGGERPYLPTRDCPLDAPSFTIHDASLLKPDGFANAARQATHGNIVIFTFHGVPDVEHPAVGVKPERFAELVQYLQENHFTCVAMRDLAAYVNTAKAAQILSFPRSLPWGGHSPLWGGVTRKDNRLYLCVEKLPADRMLTLPNMTIRIERACFLADPQQRPLAIAKLDTGIQTIVVPEFSPAVFGEKPTVIVAELRGEPIATILDFVFPGLPEATISGNEIHVNVPLATDLTQLAPTYRTGSPLVTGQPPSGSMQDFTTPRNYTITAADGSTRNYLVTVHPTLGAVGVSNPTFEKFDSLDDYDATVGKNPSGATWTFHRSKPGDEVGINLLVGPITAPTPPDASRHTAFIRGAGNGISQSITFDKGNYTVSFDVVKRRGYEARSTPLTVTLDAMPVVALEASRITETWNSYTSPVFAVTPGVHTLAFTLGEGNGMDMIDNVVINYIR